MAAMTHAGRRGCAAGFQFECAGGRRAAWRASRLTPSATLTRRWIPRPMPAAILRHSTTAGSVTPMTFYRGPHRRW